MTLPTSGALSLNDIKGEFGGPSDPALGDYYAGGAYVPAGTSGTYGAVPSSGAIGIRNFYGTSNYLDVQTVTVGVYVDKYYALYGYGSGVGSISDGTFNPKSGATIQNLQVTVSGTVTMVFRIAGSHTNAGWTNMNVAGTNYTRASASYTNGGSYTQWVWSGGSNPFGTTAGATKVVTFT